MWKLKKDEKEEKRKLVKIERSSLIDTITNCSLLLLLFRIANNKGLSSIEMVGKTLAFPVYLVRADNAKIGNPSWPDYLELSFNL